MKGLYFTTDLLFSSRAAQAARRQAVDLVIVGTSEELLEQADAAAEGLIILDLGRAGDDLAALVSGVRQRAPGATIIAYGPHVDEAALAAAEAAGCDRVLTRGQFDRQMSDILAGSGPQA